MSLFAGSCTLELYVAFYACYRRDKTLNYFNIMVKKRMHGDEGDDQQKADDDSQGDKKAGKKGGKKSKDFVRLLRLVLWFHFPITRG